MRFDGIVRRPVDRVVDDLLASSLPESVTRALVEHRVGRRVLAQLEESLDPTEVNEFADAAARRVVESAAFREVLVDVLTGDELRGVLAESAGSYGDEVAAAVRRRTAEWDPRLHVGSAEHGYGGVASRGLALVLDAALVQLAFVVSVAAVALVASLAGAPGGRTTAALVGVADAVAVVAYFAGFWTMLGQTPGMRLVGVRVVTRAGSAPGLGRSLVRAVALVVSVAIAFLGFLPALVDRRRRALPDLVAGTLVVRG